MCIAANNASFGNLDPVDADSVRLYLEIACYINICNRRLLLKMHSTTLPIKMFPILSLSQVYILLVYKSVSLTNVHLGVYDNSLQVSTTDTVSFSVSVDYSITLPVIFSMKVI